MPSELDRRKATSNPPAKILRGVESVRDHQRYQHYLDSQARSPSVPIHPNHVLDRRRPGSLPGVSPSPRPLTFHTLPRRQSPSSAHSSLTSPTGHYSRLPGRSQLPHKHSTPWSQDRGQSWSQDRGQSWTERVAGEGARDEVGTKEPQDRPINITKERG